MADKLVNSTQLDSDLTSVANAIRTKGGTSASLSFPSGFVTAIGNISTGGGSTLITKNITANGTYNASSDNADGYSSVTVAVPPAPYVTGTFTGTEAGVLSVPLSYTGDGYPVAVTIYPDAGTYNSESTFYTTVQKSAICVWACGKCITSSSPDYTYSSGTLSSNQVSVLCMYKNSDSDATVYTSTQSTTVHIYGTGNPSENRYSPIIFNSSTSLKVMIAGTSYGFMEDVAYRYHIMYSA